MSGIDLSFVNTLAEINTAHFINYKLLILNVLIIVFRPLEKL